MQGGGFVIRSKLYKCTVFIKGGNLRVKLNRKDVRVSFVSNTFYYLSVI